MFGQPTTVQNTQNREEMEKNQRQSDLTMREQQIHWQIRNQALEIQKMLVPGAEDVNTIGEMMVLKDEVVQYIELTIEPIKGIPPVPLFYTFSLFSIAMNSERRGHTLTYVHHLTDIIRLRLEDRFPMTLRVHPFPTWDEMQKTIMRFTNPDRTKNAQLTRHVHRSFELLLGETFQFIQKYYERHRRVPRTINFFFHFCVFFRNMGYKKNNAFLDEGVVHRMMRNLGHIHENFFSSLQYHLNRLLSSHRFQK